MFYEIGVPKNFAKLQKTPGQLLLEHIKCTRKDDMSNRKVPVLEHGLLLGIGCIGRTRHLASCNSFTRDVNEMLSNIRTPLSPSLTSRQEQLFHRTPTSGCFRQ